MRHSTEKFIQKIPGWLEQKEGRFLEHAVKSTEKLKGEIVEIGSFCGKSTIYLAQSKGKVNAVDPHKGDVGEEEKYGSTYTTFIKNVKTAGVINKVIPHVETSLKASRKWKKPIRILFIDGLHDEKNALRDFTLWSKFVVGDGIIVMHDSFCRWCGSESVAVNKIVRSNKFYKIGAVGSIIYGVKGKGSFTQRFIKRLVAAYLVFRVQLNHLFIILKNLSVLKNKIPFKTHVTTSYKLLL